MPPLRNDTPCKLGMYKIVLGILEGARGLFKVAENPCKSLYNYEHGIIAMVK
jgi:hypothetical protein